MIGTGACILIAFAIGLGTGLGLKYAKNELIIKNLNERLSYVVMEYNRLFMEKIQRDAADDAFSTSLSEDRT